MRWAQLVKALEKQSLVQAAEGIAKLALAPSALDASTGRRLLAGSLALGILGDALFYNAASGLNVPLWTVAFLGVYALAWRGRSRRPPAHQIALLVSALVFSLMVAWRGSLTLQAFNLMATFGCLVLAVALPSSSALKRISLLDLAVTCLGAAVALAAGLPRVVADGSWSRRMGLRSRENTLVAGRVVLLALPLIVCFGGLFVAADAVFQARTEAIFSFDPGGLPQHAFWFLGGAWLACGLLWLGLVVEVSGSVEAELPEDKRLRTIETGVVLGSLALLFAAFVLIQVRYLFGGESLVQQTIGLTYAQYARRGFFELVTAAALLLPVLLAFDWARRRDKIGAMVFRVLAGVLVLLLFVVMLSAMKRMHVYMDAFGLTQLRLYVVTILLWLGAVFVWFGWTVLRGRRNEFVLGAAAAAVVALLALNVVSPDALIATTNTSRLSNGRSFDAVHASQLGPEAAPDPGRPHRPSFAQGRLRGC